MREINALGAVPRLMARFRSLGPHSRAAIIPTSKETAINRTPRAIGENSDRSDRKEQSRFEAAR